MATRTPPRDLHADITNRLIAAIEQHPGQFTLPWRQQGGSLHLPRNAVTRKPYNGVNVLSLWVAAAQADYTSPIWATYRQWTQLGAQVRQGERASIVVFYKDYAADPDPDRADDTGRRRVARATYAFNASQVDGFKPDDPPLPPPTPLERIATADAFITATGAKVRIGGDRAFFNTAGDFIQLPDPGRFTGTRTMSVTEAYYAVGLHELTHWTGARTRLDRQFGTRFGDQAYAAEELVAEIGAAFLCAELGITQDVRPDHAQYLRAWLKLLKGDARAIFVAAAKASEATTFLKGLVGRTDTAEPSTPINDAAAEPEGVA